MGNVRETAAPAVFAAAEALSDALSWADARAAAVAAVSLFMMTSTSPAAKAACADAKTDSASSDKINDFPAFIKIPPSAVQLVDV